LAWLKSNGVEVTVRPIVESPPTLPELSRWIERSGLPLKKWLNTSGQSYRALGKAKIEAATDATITRWLSEDGKLLKRPVLIDGDTVLVGFQEPAWAKHFGAS
jgi:arsenate reductase